jgi:hypothetical protein
MTTPPPPPPGGPQPPFQPGQPPAAPPPGYGPPPQGYPQQQPPQGYPPQQAYPQQPAYAPPPGGFAPPQVPTYATPPPANQHKLSGKLIATLVAAVVIVAGGVGAAFAFSSGNSNTPTPVVSTPPAPNPGPSTQPAPNPGPSTQPAPNPGPSTQPAPNPGPSTQPAPNPGPSTQPAPNPGGNSIPIANGVAVTPAAGWSLEKQGSGFVILAANGTQLIINVYRAQSSNITQDFVTSINTFTKGTTGLKIGKSSPPAHINGRNFTELQTLNFQFQISGQQGTQTIQGLFVQFLNEKTGSAAFCVYGGTSASALQSNSHGALQMIGSIE